ncbi:MAG: fatty acid hydroxylase [Gammaproteobacteria bacterium]|nr:fatty acid hydroxylase [Gammaproteobacteria bacterium]OUT96384.1 MAG: fatty acid hydroxylase [Gammaproteobacteria bacterium TMED36]
MISAVNDYTIYAIGAPIILCLIISEIIISSKRGLQYYNYKDSLGSIGLITGNVMVNIMSKGMIIAFYLYLYQFRLFDFSVFGSIWIEILLTLLAIDFIYYWFHRTSHHVRFFWAIHMNHHSSEEMNFLVALRQAWFNPFFRVSFFFVLPLIGFNPLLTLIVGAASTLWAVIQHTKMIGKLGPLEWIFVTPSAHRVHHGVNDEYMDKNFGNLFIVWDRMFGTYQPEEESVIYGLKRNVKTSNPLKITLFTWREIFKDFANSIDGKDKIKSIFGSPDWEPREFKAKI